MTQDFTTRTQAGSDEPSASDRAKDAASQMGDTARQEAGRVTEEAKRHGRELYGEAQARLRDEADAQASRASSSLRSVSGELRSMADASKETQGPASSVVRAGAGQLESLADRLDQRGLNGVMDDVGRFARRSPGMFLAATFGVGLLAGRLIRNVDTQALSDDVRRAASDSTGSQAAGPDTAPTAPTSLDEPIGSNRVAGDTQTLTGDTRELP